jgi:MFS family permease
MLPSLAATIVLIMVPNDSAGHVRQPGKAREPLQPFKPSRQLALVIFLFFVIFSMTQLIRLATPIALRDIHGESGVEGITGIAFTLAGLASAISVLLIAPNFFRAGRQRVALISACLACACAYVLLAEASTVGLYVTFFVVISLLQAAMIPPTNSLIAGNVPRSRRAPPSAGPAAPEQ